MKNFEEELKESQEGSEIEENENEEN